jgi:hypothetical protein
MGKPNVSIADPALVYVPPSQQGCQVPVPKPGELLPEVAKQYLRERTAWVLDEQAEPPGKTKK